METNFLENEDVANRKARSIVEILMFSMGLASLAISITLVNFDLALKFSSWKIFSFVEFFPEYPLIGDQPDVFRNIIAASNISCLLYLFMYTLLSKPEVISDNYRRQDRKNMLNIMALFFYALRVGLLFTFASERGMVPENGHFPIGSNPFAALAFPAVNVVALACLLLSIRTKAKKRG